MTDDTRPADITTEARRLAEAATPGPWEVLHEFDQIWVKRVGADRTEVHAQLFGGNLDNAAFIAWCRTGVHALLERIAELEKG